MEVNSLDRPGLCQCHISTLDQCADRIDLPTPLLLNPTTRDAISVERFEAAFKRARLYIDSHGPRVYVH